MASQSADVIIVGGGIVGCSAALFLSREGQKVILVEKDAVASHASGFAFGVLLPPLFDDPRDPERALNIESFKLHRQLAEDLPAAGGQDPQLKQKAAVMLALSAREVEQYKGAYNAVRQQSERDVRWLSQGELSHIEARIAPDIPGGLYMGDTFEVDAYGLTRSMWQVAEKRGARLVSRHVSSIKPSRGNGIVLDAGGERLSAASVIIAAGPWSGTLLESVGVRVPVSPLKGQIVRLQAPGPEMKVSLWWHGDYVSTKSDGLFWCGTTEERVGFDEKITDEARDGITASAQRVLPFLSEAELVKQTACLRPITPDGLPVIGRVPGMENVVLATGAGRHGIAIGPGMGRAAADIAQGNEPEFDVSGLSLQRF